MSERAPILSVTDLRKHYRLTEGVVFSREVGRVRAVDGISFDLYPGETLGLVGETGCGKSTTAKTVLRLLEPTGGAVHFDGRDVTAFDGDDLERFRRRAGMVFQDPTSTLDPRMSIGESVGEPLLIHGVTDRSRRRERVTTLLERVGLSAEASDRYPHELSGGQKQRAALARALVLNPDLLVADEPVNALDASVQAEFLALLEDLKVEFDLSVLFISHDLNVVREVADRTAVMYLGEVVEKGPTDRLFRDPSHPYTQALVASIPEPDPERARRSVGLDGEVPEPSDPPDGCRFHTRCPAVIQPEGMDLDQDEWRSIVAFRRALKADGVDVDELRARREETDGTDDPEGLRAAVRAEFELPGALSDPTAEAALDEATDAVARGDVESGLDRLEDAFSSVCIEDRPDLEAVDEDRRVACHLRE